MHKFLSGQCVGKVFVKCCLWPFSERNTDNLCVTATKTKWIVVAITCFFVAAIRQEMNDDVGRISLYFFVCFFFIWSVCELDIWKWYGQICLKLQPEVGFRSGSIFFWFFWPWQSYNIQPALVSYIFFWSPKRKTRNWFRMCWLQVTSLLFLSQKNCSHFSRIFAYCFIASPIKLPSRCVTGLYTKIIFHNLSPALPLMTHVFFGSAAHPGV